MNKFRFGSSWGVITCLFSIFLIAAGFSRYLETDSGNVLIHDIDVESYEGFFYGARLFRPIQASSMNQRPGVLIIPGPTGNRYTGDHIAMEFARRGFVVLTIEDFGQGMTQKEPDYYTENHIDAGYNFLTTRTFTDHARTALITFYTGADKIADSKYQKDFTSIILVSPDFSHIKEENITAQFYLAQYETDPDYRIQNASPAGINDTNIKFFDSSHAGMMTNKDVISTMLEKLHEDLAIPNDAPLWFDASEQRAQVLILLRLSCLFLLMLISVGISTSISYGKSRIYWKTITGIIIPAVFFILISEFMNFFLISVRLGTPFNYLPSLTTQKIHFNLIRFVIFIIFCLLCSVSFGKSRKFFLSDIFVLISFVICAAGFLPILFGNRSGWETAGIAKFRWCLCMILIYSAANSFFLRIEGKSTISRIAGAWVTGIIFYLISSGLPAEILPLGGIK